MHVVYVGAHESFKEGKEKEGREENGSDGTRHGREDVYGRTQQTARRASPLRM